MEGSTLLAGQLPAFVGEFATDERGKQIGAIGNAVAVLPRQPLFDQPLLAADQGVLRITAEPAVTDRGRLARDQFPVEPVAPLAVI